jgi:hypothetical protein
VTEADTVKEVTIDTNLTRAALGSIAVAIARHHKSKVQEAGNAAERPNIPRICIAADALAAKPEQTDCIAADALSAKPEQTEKAQMMKDVKRYYVMHPESRWISVAGLRDRNIAKEVRDSTRLIQPEGERFITALMGRTPSISTDDPGYESKVERLVQAMYAAGWIEASKNTKQRLELYDAIKDLDVDL